MRNSISTVEDIYPLSPMQAGMLFHALYDETSPVHFVQLTWGISGELQVPAFQKAWQTVIQRYPILRTSFSFKGLEKPLQVVRRDIACPWVFHDWARLGETEQKQELQRYLDTDKKRGFDLSEAPLMRLHLIKTGRESHYFICSFHHLLLDGWSFSLVVREVLALYGGFSQGSEVQLDPPPAYKEYIAWLTQQDVSRAKEFWQKSLKGFRAPTPIRIRKEKVSGVQHEQDYCVSALNVPEQVTADLLTLARQHQVTLSTLIHGAWAILLSRYSGEEDVVFGATVAARPAELSGIESMVGLFVNTLPVRIRTPLDALLLDWLKEVQREQFKARSYEYSQLAEVQRCSDVPAGIPLFETILVFENYPVDKALRDGAKAAGLGIEALGWTEQTNFPLTLAVYPGRQLQLKAAYDRNLYPTDAIERMLGHLTTLLQRISKCADERVRDLSLLGDQEKRQLLEEWNQTESDFPREKCIHELFEDQVGRTPGAVAVEYENEELTYEQLDRRAGQLSRQLQELGIGPDKLVGICAKRSLEMIIGLLGVLKAGGAYVPIDPEYPEERMAFMLQDTQASVLLTQQELLPRLPAFSGSILSLDRPLPDLDESRRVHSRPRPNPGNLAYVIYTSGSTGKPKGVQIHHAGLCNTITTTARTFHLDSNSRVAQVASFTFDASVAEIFGALTTGASLHLLNASSLLTPLEFRNLLLDKRINFIGLSPSLLNVLEEDEFPQLQTIAVGGETCSLQTAGKWGKGRKFFNAYAPTESTVFSTIFDCSGKYDGVVPVGRPVANAQVYILDREMQPSPVGIPGELHLGGVGLARGYLNLPDLTAERFVANPFSAASGERLYKTGDMARRQPDGNIEFLGRIDSQVKIRGFRIELGEVETVLQQHQDIENAVVIVREDLPGDKRLVAYISLKEHHHRAEKELKAYLAAKLPDYMVPGAIVELEAFPLTSNGKVDRNLLPAPELVRRETGQDYVAPRTTTEEMLEALWAKVLGLKRVGRDENFFELGGHSLLATQIISRLRHTWAINLPLKILFEDPTIAGLGRAIDRFGGTRSAALPILPVSRDQDLPLSFAQQRLWFLEQLEAGNSGYNLSTAVRLKGKLNLSALEKSLDYVVQRHEALRTTFPAVEGRGIQFIHERSAVSLELIDLRATKDGEQRTADLLMESAQSAFDLSRGPLFRTLLLQLGDEEHVLQLTTHHIISDGWSMGVLVRETSALYDAFTAGIEPALEELKIQYADYAAWQRDWLKGEVLEAQVNYWRSQLADARVPQLATDYPPGRVASHMGRLEMRVLDRELTEELTGLSRRENVTLFMFLLAAFQVLLWRYTGENDVVVGTPIANRNRQEIENLIGMFVNTLVMRTTLKVDECFQQLLKQVREAALAAYAHQDLPFEKLVDELQPERELSRTPLFQVMFVHQNLPTPQMFLGGLTLSPVEYETEVAQFDLMMVIAEREQGLQIAAQYKSELFSRETIQRLLGHYECLLIGLGASLKQSIHAIPYFSRAERDQLLEEWNHINPQSEPDSCIQQLFEKQAHRTPDAVAVRHNGCESSYRQLNERANQLAHYLRRCGVGPEVYAGICVERSLEMIVGIVAILKAGGAYVPLDPNYPAERLRYTLEDSGAPVLLAQEATANRLPPYSGTLINLDTRWDEVSCESPENPQGATFPENLAYAIYTSGSTGRPKGVAVRHSSVAELLRWAHCVFSPAELQGVLASASICFDLSVFEMFAPLTCGGTVFIAADALELPRMADAAGVTLINTVPSAIRELVRIRAIPESVRTVNLAGEALPAELVRDVYATSRVERVLNLYGPTEDTTYSTFAQPERDAATVTIGRPITNTSSYVLDDWMQPVPVGIVGNLYLGGAGLSRGYWNRPAHTAEKFLPNPFGPGQGERIYATGDLARWRSEGTLEFLGRKDSQVKLRGFRIEPGEIEAVLSKHPQVNNCAVTVRGRTSGEKQLAAFIAATEGSEVTHNDLRAYLKDKLPEYMIPAIFVCLDRLPLTPNGKVDYQSLTLPKDLDSDSEIADLPRTPEEETLCQVWAEVLGVQRVGTRENFFQLGGDSILSIQIVARANRAGLQITPRQIFENQTVAELAMVARRADVIQAEQGIVSGPVPLTPIQQWFFEQELQDPHHFNQAVMLAVRHELDQEILEKVVAGLMRHHDALRMRFRRDSAGQWQEQNGLREDSKTVVDRVDLSRIDEDCRTKELERLAGEWQASLNLESGPLLRFVLFDLGPKKAQRLLVVIHHLVVDGVSWRILLEDLESNYRELRLTGATEFTKKTSSFQQWARWIQEQLAQSKELADEVVYWQKVLAGSIEPLPVDFAKGENTVGSADSIQLQLSEARTQALIQAASRAYRLQVQEVLLAALFGTLSAWSGAKSLVLEIEGHGREEVSELLDVTRTVGWFTTIFPVRLEMSVAEDLGRLLKYVKEVLHNTPQRGLGYGVLRYLHPDRQIREGLRPFRPIEISFNYLGQIDQVLEPEGVFTGAPESSGIVQSPYQKRTHILDITASVQHRELQIQLFYSRNLHQRSTLQGIGDELMRRLDRLTAHCESLAVRQYTPSDFSWVELDQGSLDELLHGGDEVEQIYPLTPMQEGMLFHTVAAEQAGVYFEQLTCILEGELQVEALARAWQQVVDHHEILRSRFAWGVRDQIVRVVEKKTQIHLQSKDWRALPQQTREQNLQEYLRDDLARGFDLKQPPLMRLVLIRVEAKKYWLVWDFHHLLLDGWSLPVVLRDVFASYTALCKGEAPSLDRPSVYKEYARWLRRQDLRKAEEFWRERLKGFHAPTKLGVEKPIEAMRDLEPGSEDLFLSEEASRGLDQLARTHQLTLNTLVQGMWALLLSQYSGTSEVVFGSTISGRPGEVQGIEKLVGVFINTLPVRVRVREDEELIPWLKNIQQCQVEQRQYEYTSLADIQRWSELPGGTPLFSTIVVFENTPIEAALEQEMKDSGLHVASLFRREQTNYPVEVMATPGRKLLLRMIYAKNEYAPGTASQILKHLRDLLESTARNGNVILSRIAFSKRLELPALVRNVGDAVPLSYHQERLWFIDRFEAATVYESSPIYHNIPLGLWLQGPVDSGLLEQAINEVIARHQALQVRIADQGERTVQVRSICPISLKVANIECIGGSISKELAIEWITHESRVPFALSREPLVRATLLRCGAEQSLLVVVVHHIAADRASLKIIASELSEIYTARTQRRDPFLSEDNYSYLDYALWQHRVPDHVWMPAWLYWKQQLGGDRANLELPSKRPRHAIHVF
jgi:amino acid adenylation domain-containing protein/non-ribosomal peptide synthase protein (TIGR01720 family)